MLLACPLCRDALEVELHLLFDARGIPSQRVAHELGGHRRGRNAAIPRLVVITEGVPVQDSAEIAAYLDGDNDLTLSEIIARFFGETGRRLSQTTVFRSLARSEVTLKKSHSSPPSA